MMSGRTYVAGGKPGIDKSATAGFDQLVVRCNKGNGSLCSYWKESAIAGFDYCSPTQEMDQLEQYLIRWVLFLI